jgi:hypothetical protein
MSAAAGPVPPKGHDQLAWALLVHDMKRFIVETCEKAQADTAVIMSLTSGSGFADGTDKSNLRIVHKLITEAVNMWNRKDKFLSEKSRFSIEEMKACNQKEDIFTGFKRQKCIRLSIEDTEVGMKHLKGYFLFHFEEDNKRVLVTWIRHEGTIRMWHKPKSTGNCMQ